MGADLTPSYLSTINNVTTNFSDRTALSLPDLKKSIMTAMHAKHEFAPRTMTQVTNSYSARFPAAWKMGTPRYHTVGVREVGEDTPPARNYRDITLDDRVVLSLFIDELDSNARALINFMPLFTTEMGQSIANFDDKNAAIVIALTARANATVTGGDTGGQITKAGVDVNVGALNASLWDAKNDWDEKNVSEFGRYAGYRPAQYNLLAAAFDRPFHRELGQGGSIGARVYIPAYAGFDEIFMSNNIPSTNIGSSPTGSRNTYHGNFTKTVALYFQMQAVGTVVSGSQVTGGAQPQPNTDVASQAQLVDVREVVIPEAYGKLLLASLITGHGVLDPVRAKEVVTP